MELYAMLAKGKRESQSQGLSGGKCQGLLIGRVFHALKVYWGFQ